MGASGERTTLSLVGPLEASPEDGRINYMAPVGMAVLGRRVGDEVELPGGAGTSRVCEIEILPEVAEE
jgi:transcription elongation GreA/GreB family factor